MCGWGDGRDHRPEDRGNRLSPVDRGAGSRLLADRPGTAGSDDRLGLAIAHWGIGGVGAGCLWEWSNLAAFAVGTRGETISFPLSAVKDVRIGRGWARKDLWLVIPPFVPAVNQWAEGYCVSFEAPGGEDSGEVVYALHMRTQEDAQALADLLQSTPLSQA